MHHELPDGLKMYYEVLGNEDAPWLVLVNGVTQSAPAWKMMTPLLEKDYRILIFDFIFQGQSDKKGEVRPFDQLTDDMVSLLDAVGAQKVYMAGISFGGAATQHFMVRYPDRLEKAVLMATLGKKSEYFKYMEFVWHKTMSTAGMDLLTDFAFIFSLSENYFENPLVPIDTLKQFSLEINDPVSVQKLMDTMKIREDDYLPQLEKVTIPTMVVQGSNDTFCTPAMGKEIADHLPNGEFKTIPNVGHALNLEAIPQTVEVIRSFCQ
ncbi:MAG: alpha/beta hydrolase [SAR324 cluster bacterium]|nr:alpha/beta hydrolase [SAR324 cluster bacterium]